MSYCNELSFATGYYHIDPDGTVYLSNDMPEKMKERFNQVWPELKKKILAQQAAGHFSSHYPILKG